MVAKGPVGVYHCWNRCVQRAFLCRRDPVTGIDYEHRRDWIEKTEQILASLFGVDIAFLRPCGSPSTKSSLCDRLDGFVCANAQTRNRFDPVHDLLVGAFHGRNLAIPKARGSIPAGGG